MNSTANTAPFDATQRERFVFSLFLAGAIHALVIFGVAFTAPEGWQSSPTLEVTLAQHRSAQTPVDADYLAQHNQQASGIADTPKELSSNRRAEFADTQIHDVNPLPQQQTKRPADQRRQLVTTIGNSPLQAPELPAEDKRSEEKRGDAPSDLDRTNPKITSLQARLDKIRQTIAQRPRVRRLTSVATKASADAAYLHEWRQKVEAVGSDNFPEEALQQQITGSLRMMVRLLPSGAVEKVVILESSGERILDDAAQQIMHLAAPFAPFPAQIRKEVDRLEIIRTWRFEMTGFSTSASDPPKRG
ncbi:energy transducer TonB [Microbulbifer sp. 2205BS26-8]|uniref:energy transducer TonB n=1 Tax=Microbulbifer sp. 2205BS26-8 TaxID=3064386 RepID=UPI00273E5A2C|nr:energy transducer TonB [Microbulbifer sp. 2205BS26-8]MDP5208137.1 TonB family protein [Microbulbifer sp. 2205BS26-8]